MSCYSRVITYALVAAIIIVSLSGCSIMEPPGIDRVERRFNRHYNDIQTVVDFIISLEYETIIINSNEKTGLKSTDGYHYESIALALDAEIEEAVNRLLNGKYEGIFKNDGTVKLVQWHRFNDVGCGVAYAINSQGLPEVQYVTELIPMETEGWYYYISDFNQWRLVAQGTRSTGDGVVC